MRFSPFDQLPRSVMKKIAHQQLEPATANTPAVTKSPAAHECWIWTGYSRPAGRRMKASTRRPNSEGDQATHYLAPDKILPMIHHPAVGYPVPAHRYVYSVLSRLEFHQVPKLDRCANPLCVNPHHSHPIPGAVRFNPPSGTEPRQLADVLSMLKKYRPSSGMGTKIAAEECGLDENRITPDIWRAYQVWDDAEPED